MISFLEKDFFILVVFSFWADHYLRFQYGYGQKLH